MTRNFLRIYLKNSIVPTRYCFFFDGVKVLDYLTSSKDQPFLILSDINLPKMNGVKLRENIHNNEQLRLKCIPYLFFTTSADQRSVIDAYAHSIQGFFTKPSSYKDLHVIIASFGSYINP